MGIETQIQLFDNAKIRVAWDDEKEKYFFSVVDVIGVLTESADGRTYWKVLKNRLLKEGNETVTNCNQLKLPASDGKMRLTDVAWWAKEGGNVAKAARLQLETTIGESVVTSIKASDYIRPIEEYSENE